MIKILNFIPVILFSFIFSTTNIWSDEIIIHNLSYHISEKDENYNNNNFGIGYKYQLKNNYDIVGGYYYNSFKKDTFYFGAEKWFDIVNNFRLGVVGGILTNYPYRVFDNINAIPAVGLITEFDINNNIKLDMLYTTTEPLPDRFLNTNVFHFQLRFPIDNYLK